MMLKHLLAMGLAVLLCWPGDCPAQTDDPGPVHVGDRWSYDIRDGATGDLRQAVTIIVVDINDKEITTRVMYPGKDRPQVIIFDPDWGRFDDSVRKFQPREGGIRKPLEVGKQWRWEATMTDMQSGVVLRLSARERVAGKESITTPAGTFDTFRIETTVRETNTRDQTKSATATRFTWYAPAVNRWVRKRLELRYEGRLRDSHTEELTDYSRKP